MLPAIHLNKNDIPAHLRAGYNGNKFKARAALSITIRSDAGLWSGGTRDFYYMIRLADGANCAFPGHQNAPWNIERVDKEISIDPGFAIVRHSHFCGDDMGLEYYINPVDIAKLVPYDDGPELCKVESMVLYITRAFKSFARNDEYRRAGISEGEAGAIKARLINLGYLNKAGAITTKGKNKISNFRP
jgi:hypothetical protein